MKETDGGRHGYERTGKRGIDRSGRGGGGIGPKRSGSDQERVNVMNLCGCNATTLPLLDFLTDMSLYLISLFHVFLAVTVLATSIQMQGKSH